MIKLQATSRLEATSFGNLIIELAEDCQLEGVESIPFIDAQGAGEKVRYSPTLLRRVVDFGERIKSKFPGYVVTINSPRSVIIRKA